ncbi:MAG: DUF1735 domain-containing protein [Bacteroidota bacterium]|jgi:hypothetical protein
MKNISLRSLLVLGFLSTGLIGCLKDKGFDNYEYGINDPDTQNPGIGFPLAANSKNTIGLNAQGTTQSIDDLVYVNLNAGIVAPTDIKVTIALDSNIVKAYNTANASSIQIMQYNLFSVAREITIPAGARSAQIPINVPSTLSFSPLLTYGVGIKITAVSGNYVIASNLQNLMVEFTIKNKYDGKYNLRGFHNRPGLDLPYNQTVLMITSGANSVNMYWPALPGFAHPLNGGTTYYGSFTANFYFNLNTNQLTSWDWSPYATTFPTAVSSTSRYEPADKIIYFHGWYNNNPSARAFFDTLRYLGPR